jgi:hypothetical protein
VVGVLLVGSVGNHQSYSCLTSPAESPHPIIVGGTIRENNLPLPSNNYGDCVDIYAPGDVISLVTSTTNRLDVDRESELQTFSGSSAGTAIVTGVVALLFQVMQTPFRHFPQRFATNDSKISSLYTELQGVLQKYPLPLNPDSYVSLSSIIQSLLDPSDYLLFVRNIMISTHHSLNYNRTKFVHWMSYTTCDYSDTNELISLAIEGVVQLIHQFQQPKAFRRIKKNLSNHLKQQIEAYYQQNEKE